MTEEWRAIEGYEGLYEVSNLGRVKGLKSGVIFRPQITSDKLYYQVQLRKDGKQRTFKIHRLVALAFLRPPLTGEEVDHIDDDGFNNNLTNLQWLLKKDNAKKAHRNGRQAGVNHSRFGKKGLDNSSTKLFSLKNPEGEIITSFTNDFRDTYGLDPSAVWRVRTGIFTHTKGWTLP